MSMVSSIIIIIAIVIIIIVVIIMTIVVIIDCNVECHPSLEKREARIAAKPCSQNGPTEPQPWVEVANNTVIGVELIAFFHRF
jgi:flagellar basal body-associated protein FliL